VARSAAYLRPKPAPLPSPLLSSQGEGEWEEGKQGKDGSSPMCRIETETLQSSQLNLNFDLFPLSAVIHNRHLPNPSW